MVDVSAQGDMKQLTLFNLVKKIFYYNDVIIAVCECHEQKLRLEYYFKTEWDGYQMPENIWNHDAAGRVVLLLFSRFWKLLLQQRN